MADDTTAMGDFRQMRSAFCLAAWLALALLGGCAGHPDLAGQASGCKVVREARMTMRRVRDFILLPGRLDGRPVQMVLDTGAEVSTISPGIAADFALALDSRHGRVLRGVGGDVRTDSVLAEGFALGDLPARRTRFSLGTGDVLPGLSPPVAGLLGTDQLDGRDLDLDTPRQRLGLYVVRACPGFRPWAGRQGVAITRTPSGLAFVVADLGGSAVRALLDTGARTSFMTRRLAAALGITDVMLAADPVSVKVGISRSEIEIRQHRFAQISLGAVTWRDVPVAIADVELPGVDMLLGVDLLGQQPIWISPARGMLWLR